MRRAAARGKRRTVIAAIAPQIALSPSTSRCPPRRAQIAGWLRSSRCSSRSSCRCGRSARRRASRCSCPTRASRRGAPRSPRRTRSSAPTSRGYGAVAQADRAAVAAAGDVEQEARDRGAGAAVRRARLGPQHALAAAEPHPAADLEPAALQPAGDARVRHLARDRRADERPARRGRARVSAVPHTLLGSALGLLLVFRTNAAYDRYWEARKQWQARAPQFSARAQFSARNSLTLASIRPFSRRPSTRFASARRSRAPSCRRGGSSRCEAAASVPDRPEEPFARRAGHARLKKLLTEDEIDALGSVVHKPQFVLGRLAR